MRDENGLNRRNLFRLSAASAGLAIVPQQVHGQKAQNLQPSIAPAIDGMNLGLITAFRHDFSATENVIQHQRLGNALSIHRFGLQEVRGQYQTFGETHIARAWWVAGNIEDSGNLKGHLRKIALQFNQHRVLVKGYYRRAVLYDTSLKRNHTQFKRGVEIGAFRPSRLGAFYQTLISDTQTTMNPMSLEADSLRVDSDGGRWTEIGVFQSRTFFNSARWITFDPEDKSRVSSLFP